MFRVSVKDNFRKKIGASQPTISCSKLTTETLEQGVKYIQNLQ